MRRRVSLVVECERDEDESARRVLCGVDVA